jgi:hypothetical protein
MLEEKIEIQPGQTLTLLEMADDVVLCGGDEDGVVVQMQDGEEPDLIVTQVEAGPAISARRACEVHLPGSVPVVVRQAMGNLKASELSSLNAEQVRGDLKIREVQQVVLAEVYGHLKASELASLRVVGTIYGDASLGEIQAADVQNVRGSLRAKEMTSLRVSRIAGDLTAKEISGTLDADRVDGNALLKEIRGLIRLDRVAGNLVAKELAGGAQVDRIGGNLVLSGGFGTGSTYRFQVGGNAVIHLQEAASVHMTITARGSILSSLELAEEQRTGRTLTGTVGEGGAELVIDTQGNAVLGSKTGDRAHCADPEVSRRVEESLRGVDFDEIGRQVGEGLDAAMDRLRVKMETMDWARIGERAQEAVQRAMERMQQDVDRWADRRARQAEREARHAERDARRAESAAQRAERLSVRPGTGSVAASPVSAMDAEEGQPDGPAAAPGSQPGLEQERLAILKMVGQGQISPEEAGILLDALEP